MQNRLERFRLATRDLGQPAARRGHELMGRAVASRARLGVQLAILVAVAGAVLAVGSMARAQYHEPMPGFDPHGFDAGAAPITHFGSGSYFSQDLGTVLRVRYNTKSYGQERRGNLDIGTFQAVNFDDSIAFFDGQVTLNDVHGIGFNLGVGYRWLSILPYAIEPERVLGVSVWADGTSTEAGNFFPQVGVSYESLGEMWDLRINGYIPVGASRQVGDFVRTGEIDFQGNFLSQITEAVVDRSLYAGELEVARRLGAHRDAWAFAGPYFLANDELDTAGYKVGLRGYAYPDLLLQFAVTGDEIFKTTSTFSLVWFVGRTRTDFRPACGVLDRFREPVMRNDYVALARDTAIDGIPLTAPDGTVIRFVHVDSEAPDGGDGTIESPLNDLADIHPNSMVGDIVLAHAESEFVGQGSAVLRDNQRFLGEGDGMVFTVATRERGIIEIPETSPGARNAPRPLILDALGDAIVLATGNEVANFDIEGGTRGLVAGAASTGGLSLHDLTIIDTSGSAMRFNDITGAVNITDVEVLGGTGFALDFLNVASTAAIVVDNFDYDGGALAAGGIRMDNFDGAFTIGNSSLTGGTLAGVAILGGSDGVFTFEDTNTLADIGGTAFFVDGGANNFTGILNVAHAITNSAGRSVWLSSVSDDASIAFNGNITDTGQGIRIDSSDGGLVLFTGNLTLTTAANHAIELLNNTGTDINFTGRLNINTTSGTGFLATNGGTLTATNTNNSITTTTGQIVSITGSEISSAGVVFGEVNRTMAAATNAILLQNNTGGPIVIGTLGDDAGESGTIQGGTADAIVVNNSANVTVSGLRIDQVANVAGVSVSKTTAGTQTVNLNDLEINAGSVGVDVTGAAIGTLNMTVNDTDINTAATTGLRFNNVNAGTIQVNNTTIDGNNTTAIAGVQINNSNATFLFDADTEIRQVNGTAFEVDGGAANITMSGDITNTTGDSIHIHNVTGGNVTMFGTVDDTGTGVTIENNTGGSINLLGTYNLTTGTDDAVEITNNTGADVSLSGLNIETTSGTGFTATGGGNLTVTGATNTITTTTGTGLEIRDMNIVGQATFESVSVDGAVNGIILENVTGGPVTITGNVAGDPDSGGTLVTSSHAIQITDVDNVALNRVLIQNAGGDGVQIADTNNAALNNLRVQNAVGDAIHVTNTGNAALNNVQIQAAGGDGVVIDHTAASTVSMSVLIDNLNVSGVAGTGLDVTMNNVNSFGMQFLNSQVTNSNVSMTATGAGSFGLLVEDTSVNTGLGNDVAFQLNIGGPANSIRNVTFRNVDFTADDASALAMTTSGAAIKTVNLLIDTSTFSNDSAMFATVDVLNQGGTRLNASVYDNTFTNADAGRQFNMTNDGASARIRLDLDGNVANAGMGEFHLNNPNGVFELFERNATLMDLRNAGTVVTDPNDAAFGETLNPVPQPTFP